MSRTTRLVALVAAACLAGPAGCASSSSGGSGGLVDQASAYGSPSAEMAVERFLEAVKSEDYQGMGRQFGTRQGPAEERFGISEVEQRMIVLAGLLQHDESSLRRADLAQIGPNRTRFEAELTGTREGRVTIPFVAVTTPDDRWYVERVEVNPLTRGVSQ